MERMQFSSRWVVVTGASSGLGREIARELASNHHANLILTARREARLAELADELRSKYRVEVDVIPADLTTAEGADQLFTEATARHPVYGVVLAAGVTHFGHWDELGWEGYEQMVQINVLSTTKLSMLFLPYLEKRAERGGILIVASMAGLNPLAYQAAYSATKAFLVNLGCALHHEMLPRKVSVTTYLPGGIATEMTAGARFNGLRAWLMPVDKCAHEAVVAFERRAYAHVPGLTYRIGSVLTRLLPSYFVHSQVASQYRQALETEAAQKV